MTGFGPYASAKVPDRKYLWTVVALFALLGLVGLGALLYKPLTLLYAIHRVERNYPPPEGWSSYPRVADKWLLLCLEAASRGNARAMDVVIDRHRVVMPAGATSSTRESIAFVAAKAQPLVFIRALERADDRRVLRVLAVLRSLGLSNDGGFVYVPGKSEVVHTIEALQSLVKSDDPETARLGAAACDFVRRRFAKELAEAEKASPTDPVK